MHGRSEVARMVSIVTAAIYVSGSDIPGMHHDDTDVKVSQEYGTF